MRQTCAITVAVALALTILGLRAVAFAQTEDQGTSTLAGVMTPSGGGSNLIMILLAPAVQTELKLTEEQKNKVFELARDASKKTREFYQQVIQSGAATNPQALMAAGHRLRQENERAVAQVLKPEQKDRAEQIHLRVEGPLAVARPELAEKLGLSRQQNQQVVFTMLQLAQAQQQLRIQEAQTRFAGGGQVATQGRSSGDQLRNLAVQQIAKILNTKQKTAFNTMLGAPFDIAKIDPSLATPSESSSAAAPPAKPEKYSAKRKRGGSTKGVPSKDRGEDAKASPAPAP